MQEDTEESKKYTVVTVDQGLASIYTRLDEIANHLDDGINGEHPKTENDSKREITTASLNSAEQRIRDIQVLITRIENFTKSIHS